MKQSSNIDLIAVLFDCDGVLVDSEPAMAKIASLALNDYGANSTQEDFMPYIGMSTNVYLGEVAKKYGIPLNDETKYHIYEKYSELAPQFVTPFNGIRDLLLKLKANGIRIAVASSAEKIKVSANLALIELPPDTFDAVITGSDIMRNKPYPDIYLLTASRCGIEPHHCIVVEDSISGVRSSKAAGMTCIGFSSAHTYKELKTAGADVVIDNISDIWNYVQHWMIKLLRTK